MNLYNIMEKFDNYIYGAYNITAQIKYFLFYYKINPIIKKNKKLENKYKGERCFIVLNGPSLKMHNLSKLRNEKVFCTNYFYKSSIATLVHPDFFCWLDSECFFEDEGENVKAEILQKFPNGKMIFNIKGYRKTEKDNNDIFYTYNKHMPYKNHVACNLSRLCSGYTTVAFFAISAAIYMGFSSIYLLGLDFEPGGFKHFDDIGLEPDNLKTKNDKSIVCGGYWGYTKAQFESYALAQYAKSKNITILNCNSQSHIRAFDFITFEDIL